ncbi:MAG: YadA-like family protein, partial [Cycloclasticus sp.]
DIGTNTVSIGSNAVDIDMIMNDPTNGQVEVLTATIGLGGLTVQGAAQLDGTLNVDGATTTNGITNTGDIATGTLQTTGLATLNSAQVDTTLNVDGATTLNSSLTQSGGDSSFTSADGLSNLTVENGEVSAGTTDAELSLTDAEVSLTLDNGVSDHGLVVTTTSTTLSGGATSSQMVLDDNGATFSEVGTGDPITVTGVADGVDPFDAVNKGQLDALEGRLQNQIDDNTSGIAAVAAMANIPAPLPGHNYSMGVGYGNFQGEQAIAFGGSAIVGDGVNVKMSAGISGSDVTIGAGAGISW